MSTKRIHVAGIAGVGMRGLAELLHARGHIVSGSDRFLDQGTRLGVLDQLEAQGISMHPQDGAAIQESLDTLVYSSAIEEDNPEWIAAKDHGVECVHRATLLAREAAVGQVVAMAGTAGKTTTTALVGYILYEAGWDPTVLNGGALVNWRTTDHTGNMRVGQSPWWVLEVDESDRSLMQFHPHTAVITNISTDHFDLDTTLKLFLDFSAQVSTTLLLGPSMSDVWVEQFAERMPRVKRIDGKAGSDQKGAWAIYEGGTYRCPLSGEHNGENLLSAVAVCRSLGVGPERIHAALLKFAGVERRLESVGRGTDFVVLDDYAHNPAKIGAAWEAVRGMGERVVGVWRPHGYGPLAQFADALAESLQAVLQTKDRLYILPVFYAGGTTKAKITSEVFVAHLQDMGLPVDFVPDYDTLFERLNADRKKGDAVVFMGARDPQLPIKARALAAAWAD